MNEKNSVTVDHRRYKARQSPSKQMVQLRREAYYSNALLGFVELAIL